MGVFGCCAGGSGGDTAIAMEGGDSKMERSSRVSDLVFSDGFVGYAKSAPA